MLTRAQIQQGEERLTVFNRLAAEKSPYLLQHKQNPVDWYPWGEEAFEKASQEDKPIFLSIGYSTCHWCHVMAHESFEDPEVAELLNRGYVSIKVDREERPDVDHIYMTVCQILTRSGGWPLTIIMTPDKRPFFAGTYFPKSSRFGRVGMIELLASIDKSWHEKRGELEGISRRVVAGIEQLESSNVPKEVGEESLNAGFVQLAGAFDREHGGFGQGMKFPSPHQLLFLLRYYARTGNDAALHMVRKSLLEMGQGGIFDHVGFGFHRYSTDPRWLVPHFEKMLYDQALLLLAYTEAYQATGEGSFAETARKTAEYVLRDLRGPEKAFYSAEDADSEGEEGKFYLWTIKEVGQLLKPPAAEIFVDAYNLTEEGNFREESTGQTTGRNILHLSKTAAELAKEWGMEAEEVQSILAEAGQTLFDARKKRIRPLLDDKILTDWNGLMIASLAKAGRVFRNPSYLRAANEAADFVANSLSDPQGRLFHRYWRGEAGLAGQLDDYAFMIFALIELYEATFDPRHLKEAMRLNDYVVKHFQDKEGGGFFRTSDDHEKLLVRARELYDGAIPSGSSVQIFNLVRLSRMTGESALEEIAARAARLYGNAVQNGASAHAMFLLGLDFALGPSAEVVIVGEKHKADTRAMLGAFERQYLPRTVLLLREPATSRELTQIAPFVATQSSRDGVATAYVCTGGSCASPTQSPEKMLSSIMKATKR